MSEKGTTTVKNWHTDMLVMELENYANGLEQAAAKSREVAKLVREYEAEHDGDLRHSALTQHVSELVVGTQRHSAASSTAQSIILMAHQAETWQPPEPTDG